MTEAKKTAAANFRITAEMNEALIKLMAAERRSRADMARLVFEAGLKALSESAEEQINWDDVKQLYEGKPLVKASAIKQEVDNTPEKEANKKGNEDA